MEELAGKVAVITGGSRGIGKAIAEAHAGAGLVMSDEARANAARTPLGRAGQTDDFPGAALFLAGAASAFITGTLLRVDGGADRQVS